jgi:hypothetical protein
MKIFLQILFLVFFVTFQLLFGQFPNIKLNKPGTELPEEVTIAINPVNPLNLAAGANINLYYYSVDGGYNWKEGELTSAYGVWGDPCVTFDPEGNLYYGHLSNPPVDGYWIDRIVVQKSTNEGVSFDDGVGIGFNPPRNQQDKEWLIADHSNSEFHGNLYVAWTQFDHYESLNPADSSRILFSFSSNHGLTWSSPEVVSDRSGNCLDSDSTDEGAVPAVGPNGEIYLSWAGPLGIIFDRSLDGGKTFGKDIFVTDQPGGWDFNVPGIYRCNGLPVTICDLSNSPYRGNIYINWSDQRNGIDNTDIFIIKSTNGGISWGDIKKVNSDSSHRHQFFTWAAVDPKTGVIYIVYYDRRNTSGDATDVYIAKSNDGGDSFSEFKISDSPFLPTANIFFGDYTNIAAYEGMVYPIWMRLDTTRLSIWTAIINDKQTDVKEVKVIRPESEFLLNNYPNPFNLSTTIHFSLPGNGYISLKLYDPLGRELRTLFDGWSDSGIHSIKFEGNNLQSGIYFVVLKIKGPALNDNKKNFLVSKIVLLK